MLVGLGLGSGGMSQVEEVRCDGPWDSRYLEAHAAASSSLRLLAAAIRAAEGQKTA